LKIEGKNPWSPKKGRKKFLKFFCFEKLYGEVGWTRSLALWHYREEGSDEKRVEKY